MKGNKKTSVGLHTVVLACTSKFHCPRDFNESYPRGIKYKNIYYSKTDMLHTIKNMLSCIFTNSENTSIYNIETIRAGKLPSTWKICTAFLYAFREVKG